MMNSLPDNCYETYEILRVETDAWVAGAVFSVEKAGKRLVNCAPILRRMVKGRTMRQIHEELKEGEEIGWCRWSIRKVYVRDDAMVKRMMEKEKEIQQRLS